jgi:protein SCO1/2
MKNTQLKTLRSLLVLTTFLMIGMAVAFYFRPQPIEQRIAGGEKLGGDFQLQTLQGEIRLNDFAGKAVVFYLGYTNCPDVCPTGLAVLSQALHSLSADEQEQVRGIFMSVDPARDSLEKLEQYASFFHPNIIGATAGREEIDRVVRQYGGFYRIGEATTSASGYAVDHSSRFYLIAPNGELITTLMHTSSPEQISTALRALLNS